MLATQSISLRVLLPLSLLVLCLAVYAPVANHGFVNYDDPMYVTANPVVLRGLTLDGVEWAFTATQASNWHPLTWISHMADVECFGPAAGPHKLVSVGFHAVNSLLIFLLLGRSTGKPLRSAFVAALFAVHPLNVESVAWVAERKTVLCSFFWLLAAGAYGWNVRRTGAARPLAVLPLFVAALLSKPMAVTFPFTLMLLDVWPLGRVWEGSVLGGNRFPPGLASRILPLVREKVPFFLLSAGFSVVAYLVQRGGYAVSAIQDPGEGIRASNALLSYVRYLGKTIRPTSLSVHYPLPTDPGPVGIVLGAGFLLLLLTVAFVLQTRSRPWLSVGWLWFLGTLVPVIGIVQAGSQAMADRYMYVPLLGILVGGVWEVSERVAGRRREVVAAVSLGGVCILLFAVLSRHQVWHWRSSVDLFRHAVVITPGSAVVRNNLGGSLLETGDVAAAEEHLREALRIQGDYPEGHYNLAECLRRRGRIMEAVFHYREALRWGARDPVVRQASETALRNLGVNPQRRQ
jgi:hypothetical protein